jgi:peptidoglycan/LPS O-acetylase OafA/YrhL
MEEDIIDSKIAIGSVLIIISFVILFGVAYFAQDALCNGFLFAMIFMALGALLMFSSSIDSLKELKRGNRDPKIIATGLMLIYFISFVAIQILVPEPQEIYYMIGLVIIMIIFVTFIRIKTNKIKG